MNNIYKVIWSKAKNCYVVASEIARSHTKSATGSKKIGGVTRRSLLASLMALSLLCGGLGVASAVDGTVDVEDIAATTTSKQVYTADKVDNLLKEYGTKENVENNRNNIATLQTTTTDQGQKIATNTANIATNTTAIAKKIDTETANATYATKDALNNLKTTVDDKADEAAVTTALADKADKTTVNALDGRVGVVAGKVTALETTVGDASRGLVKDVNELKTQGNDLNTAIGTKANQSDLVDATNRITANEGNITALQNKTAKLSADGTKLIGMTAVSGATVSGTNVNAGALKVTGKISDGTVKTTLAEIDASMKQTETNKADIVNLKTTTGEQDTAIKDLQKKTTNISYADGAGTSIDGITVKDGNIVGNGNSAITGLANVETDKIKTDSINGKSLTGTTVATEKEVKDVADAVKTETDERKAADTALEEKIAKNTKDIATLDGKVTTAQGDIQTNANNIKTNSNAIADTNKRTAGIKRDDVRNETTIENNVTVDNLGNVKAEGNVTADGKLTGKGVDAGTGDITTTGAVNAGSLNVENASNLKGDVTMDKTLSVTGDTSLGALNVTGESSLKNTQVNGTLTTTGKATFKEAVDMDKGLTVTSGDTTLQNTDVKGALNVTGESSLKDTQVNGTLTTTGKATFKEAVDMDKGLTVTSGDTTLKGTKVDGKLTVTDEADLKNTKVDGTLGVTGETKLDDKLTVKGEAKFEKNVTVDKDLTVTGKLNVGEISMKNDELDINGDQHDSTTTITADGISNNAKVTDRNGVTTESKFTHDKEGSTTYAKKGDATDWKEATSNVTADGVENIAKDSKDNNNTFTQTSTDTKNTLTDKEGNTSTTRQDSKGIYGYAKDKDGNKSYTKQEGNRIAESVIGQDGKETKSEMTSTDITNTAKDGTITSDAKDIVNKATGNISNSSATMDTTVTGKATESYGELETEVKGNEKHTVKGDQTNEVDGKQINTIKNGQENIISGGQINNITGDQTTTISGTQTTTATDINRNASSGMIDTIDNAYGTNTETKVAGKTTTDVSIKGTGEKGQYIRGANESRDYLIKGTLKNSETKTAEATSTKITDGNGKTSSTIQDVTQISGSVTDGTNTSVSNVKANSIDSAVTDGSSISTINQKKNSITSQVTDGTTITKTEQDTKNITNTAKDGTITNDAKDIVNNASGNMTNTVGGDLTTTVSGNELHEVTGKQTNKIDGDQENTIGGNQTTTVTGDISNKAENITNEANTKLTDKVGENTRVLDSEGITDTVGGSTFKQRIDKIMMESKDVSIKAEETLTNEAKVITNKASEVINNEAININNTATGIITSKASEIKNQADKLISNKVGENTWENMEDGKITTSIKNGTKQNLTQSDAEKTEHSVVNGSNFTVNKQTSKEITDAVTNGTTTNVTQNTATSSNNTIADKNGNANTVISTVDGTSFNNSKAAAPVTGASGAGTAVNTNIKGNTITTGKVTMDYAEVMKDLGVRGNANIAGKTTTGSLEVKGESKLTGDVTMESNATVKKDLTVEGNTNLKNTKVDGTLDVTQKATFGDSVSIAKDLSVGGDVTAKSYKVGDKTYISAAGINANDQKITNVADGSISEGSKDAVNGGQLYGVKNDLEGKVNKVGANAAAMANLHPMEFDPDSKWNIAAAIGNYGSETAAALGAFYRPNDDVMVNLSTAFGTGENMVGGGVSVRLGKGGNKLSREETNALKAQVADLTARMDALLSVLNPNMSKDFPDVPENHWAYEAVSRLAGNDIVQGYPDGEFHGERTMTRYEMAEIIYNALSRGAEAEKELVEEFKPELQAMAASEKATAEKAEG